jgi:hypothetical protein
MGRSAHAEKLFRRQEPTWLWKDEPNRSRQRLSIPCAEMERLVIVGIMLMSVGLALRLSPAMVSEKL